MTDALEHRQIGHRVGVGVRAGEVEVVALGRARLAALIGQALSQVGLSFGPIVLISVLYLGTGLLTSFFSNNATAVLMVPIALEAAQTLDVNAKPLLMAVAYAASASFMTPIGYQTNTMVYGPGGYRYSEYTKFGAPFALLVFLAIMLIVPQVWQI